MEQCSLIYHRSFEITCCFHLHSTRASAYLNGTFKGVNIPEPFTSFRLVYSETLLWYLISLKLQYYSHAQFNFRPEDGYSKTSPHQTTLNLHKRRSKNLKFHKVTFYLARASFVKSFYAFHFSFNIMSLLYASLYWLSFQISEIGELFR